MAGIRDHMVADLEVVKPVELIRRASGLRIPRHRQLEQLAHPKNNLPTQIVRWPGRFLGFCNIVGSIVTVHASNSDCKSQIRVTS